MTDRVSQSLIVRGRLILVAGVAGVALLVAGCTAPNPEYIPLTPADSAAPPPDFTGLVVDLAMGDRGGITPPDLSGQRLDGGSLPDLATPLDLSAPQQITFIAAGSRWRYLDDGSDQGAAWQAPGFNDMPWKTGPAELGYGDNDEVTVVGFGGNQNMKFITTYFRIAFTTPFAASVKQLVLRVRRDDGVVVYLNGVEVARDNMPMGGITSRTLASAAISGADEMTLFPFMVDPKRLVDGQNVVAAEIHQNTVNSSDISFDLDLVGMTQ